MKLFQKANTISPKISVVIPIYNVEKYLEQCVLSVVNQTYKNLEIILVNDGSTDKSKNICENLEKKDSRIRFFSKQNGGVSSARNFGISKATGEYVHFLDSDDFIKEDFYENVVSVLQKFPGSYAMTNKINIDFGQAPSFQEHVNSGNVCTYPAILVTRQIYSLDVIKGNNIKFLPMNHYEDAIFNLHYFAVANQTNRYVDNAFYVHVNRPDSLTTDTNQINRYINSLQTLAEFYKFCKKNFSKDIWEKAEEFLDRTVSLIKNCP